MVVTDIIFYYCGGLIVFTLSYQLFWVSLGDVICGKNGVGGEIKALKGASCNILIQGHATGDF